MTFIIIYGIFNLSNIVGDNSLKTVLTVVVQLLTLLPLFLLSEADKLQDDPDLSVDRYGLSPDSHLADAADFSPKSPLSCADSLCGRSPDYEDFWRPPSPSASPGTHTAQHVTQSLYKDVVAFVHDANLKYIVRF